MKLTIAVINNITDSIAAAIRPRCSLFSKNLLKGYNNMEISKPKTSGMNILLASLSITNTSTTASRIRARRA